MSSDDTSTAATSWATAGDRCARELLRRRADRPPASGSTPVPAVGAPRASILLAACVSMPSHELNLLMCFLVGGGRDGRVSAGGCRRVRMPRHIVLAMPGRGEPPYGWRHGDGELVADAVEQLVIAQMRAWHSEGVGYGAIARRLNAVHTPARSGRWTGQAVAAVLEG